VALRPRSRSAVLVVEDDGPGVPPGDREAVFQPFVSRKPGGTGLGLALVSQVVRAHGGSIRVDESPLGGARFEAVLPLDAPESA
jgi:signal transduction histidine kinase